MPYIKKQRREDLFNDLVLMENWTAGDFNYVVSAGINEYLEANGVCYENINKLIGVLECAKLELYRRVAADYEDSKLTSNGDVYSV